MGLSHNTNYLVELSFDISDHVSMTSFFERPTGDESIFRLIIYHVTPQHFYPVCYFNILLCFVIDVMFFLLILI